MGVDLTLLPLLSDDFWCAHTIIQAPRDYVLFEEIKKCPSMEIPKKLSTYLARDDHGEAVYGDISEDEYGKTLKYVYAEDLLAAFKATTYATHWKHCAIIGYLEAMPPKHQIVLFWH